MSNEISKEARRTCYTYHFIQYPVLLLEFIIVAKGKLTNNRQYIITSSMRPPGIEIQDEEGSY